MLIQSRTKAGQRLSKTDWTDLEPIKINALIVRSHHEEEVADFAALRPRAREDADKATEDLVAPCKMKGEA